jgi:hypothetical protein
MRNLTFHNAVTAIHQLWDWGWTYSSISINDCQVGLDITNIDDSNQLLVSSVVFIDSQITNTPVGIAYGNTAATGPAHGNNLILENVGLSNVPVAIQGPGKATLLAGTTDKSTISGWGKGHYYTPTSGPNDLPGIIAPNARPSDLTSGSMFYERSKPQYENVPASQFLSVRAAGAAGDGTDDTAIINAVLAEAAATGKIVFFDAGMYTVTSTIKVPPGSRIVGEAYPVILSSGPFFADLDNPQPVVQVGIPGAVGTVEWSDMIISTKGAQAGAILVEWNLASTGTPSGMWDVHTRVGGFKGSDLLV